MAKRKVLSPTKCIKIAMLFNELKLSKREITRCLQVDEKAVRNAITKFNNGDGFSAEANSINAVTLHKKITIDCYVQTSHRKTTDGYGNLSKLRMCKATKGKSIQLIKMLNSSTVSTGDCDVTIHCDLLQPNHNSTKKYKMLWVLRLPVPNGIKINFHTKIGIVHLQNGVDKLINWIAKLPH
uniref:Transposase n=1 Tax=Romanomermis culicivorax TaxID=13658 RepID=A0A915JTP8_ROMCU